MDTVNFLLDRPLALLIVLVIGGVIGIALEQTLARIDREQRKANWRGRNPGKGKRDKPASPVALVKEPEAHAADRAAEQLKVVSCAAFSARSLLNR